MIKDLEIVRKQLESTDFVLKTQRQIIKDFGTVGVDFPDDFHSKPYPIDALLSEISSRLKKVNSESSNSFTQLLYQIDVPESILSDLSKTDNFCFRLAEVILKREAYKVYLRSKFSS